MVRMKIFYSWQINDFLFKIGLFYTVFALFLRFLVSINRFFELKKDTFGRESKAGTKLRKTWKQYLYSGLK